MEINNLNTKLQTYQNHQNLVNLYEQEREGIRLEINNIRRLKQESDNYASPSHSTDFRFRGSNDVVSDTINAILIKMADTDSRTGVKRYTGFSSVTKLPLESTHYTKGTHGLLNYDSDLINKRPDFASKSHKFQHTDELDNPFWISQTAAKNRYNVENRGEIESSPDDNEGFRPFSSRPAGISSKYGNDRFNIFQG